MSLTEPVSPDFHNVLFSRNYSLHISPQGLYSCHIQIGGKFRGRRIRGRRKWKRGGRGEGVRGEVQLARYATYYLYIAALLTLDLHVSFILLNDRKGQEAYGHRILQFIFAAACPSP